MSSVMFANIFLSLRLVEYANKVQYTERDLVKYFEIISHFEIISIILE